MHGDGEDATVIIMALFLAEVVLKRFGSVIIDPELSPATQS